MKSLALAKLQALSLNDSLAHAWLFVGAETSNKLEVANQFSQWLLCSNRQVESACGLCKQCQMFIADIHPDLCRITLQEDHNSILLDDVKPLTNFMTGKPQFGVKKIVLLTPAEKMNRQVANAILKNLEEPGDDTIILLLTTHIDLLLTTIVSRCQVLNFSLENNTTKVGEQQASELILDLHNLLVTKSVTAIQLVDKWIKQWPNEVLYWFELVLADLIKCRYTRTPELLNYGRLYSEQTEVNDKMQASRLWGMLEQVQQARRWFGTNNKPNLQLILENIILP